MTQAAGEDGVHEPVCSAAQKGDVEAVRALIEGGADVDAEGSAEGGDGLCVTPLMHALLHHRRDVVRYLLTDGGADVAGPTDESGRRALHLAVAVATNSRLEHNNSRQVLEALLEHPDTDVHVGTEDGQKAIHLAASERMADRVALLLHAGADPDATNDEGDTAMHVAIRSFDSASIPLLLEAGAGASCANVVGDTPLHCVALTKDAVNAKLLLRFGATPDLKNEHGDTPAHVAAREMDPKILRLLIEASADIDIVNKSGETPLHMAALNSDAETMQTLLDRECNPNPKNRGGAPIVDALSGPLCSLT